MLSALKECKDKGGKMVAVKPLPEAGLFNFKDPQTVSVVVGNGTPLAGEYLQIKVGGDLALFQALGHLLLAEEERNPAPWSAGPFVVAQTDGFEAYREARGELDWAETGEGHRPGRGQIEDVAGCWWRTRRRRAVPPPTSPRPTPWSTRKTWRGIQHPPALRLCSSGLGRVAVTFVPQGYVRPVWAAWRLGGGPRLQGSLAELRVLAGSAGGQAGF